MGKITELEKKRLMSKFNDMSSENRINYDKDDKKNIEQEMIDIYLKRVKNGSNKFRAFIDTTDDILIKYSTTSNKIDKSYASKVRKHTKYKYYSTWCVLIATTIAIQILFIFGSTIFKLSFFELLSAQSVFLGLTILLFMSIFILISKDKNYDTDNELREFTKYQFEIFMIVLFSPILILINIFRPSTRKR